MMKLHALSKIDVYLAGYPLPPDQVQVSKFSPSVNFDPMILCSFLWRIRWTTLENHSSKQMKVYEQISFFFFSKKPSSSFKFETCRINSQIIDGFQLLYHCFSCNAGAAWGTSGAIAQVPPMPDQTNGGFNTCL